MLHIKNANALVFGTQHVQICMVEVRVSVHHVSNDKRQAAIHNNSIIHIYREQTILTIFYISSQVR